MLPRRCLSLKGLTRSKRGVIRTFAAIDQSSAAESSHQHRISSFQPQFPQLPVQPPSVLEKSATDKPPVIDVPPESDPLLAYITSRLMSHGKRHTAARRTSRLLLHIHAMSRSPPLPILREAVNLAAPSIRIVSHKYGGKTTQVPMPLSEKQRVQFAMKWIFEASKTRNGKAIEERLAREVLDILKQEVVEQKQDSDVKEPKKKMAKKNLVLQKKMEVHYLGMVNRANVKARI